MPSVEEQLTEQFYRWEIRGRGWQVWDEPVTLEPPFRPFIGHYIAGPARSPDDGRKPTAASRFFEGLFGSSRDPEDKAPHVEEEPPPVATIPSDIEELRLALPSDLKVTKEQAQQFLLGVGSREVTALEITGHAGHVHVGLACSGSRTEDLERAVRSYYPEVGIAESGEGFDSAWEATNGPSVIVDFGLSREFMLPLKVATSFDVDPLIAIIGSLDEIGTNEVATLQVVFSSVKSPWAASILRAVTDDGGSDFFADAPQILSQAKEKVSHPLFAVTIRVAAKAQSEERAWELTRQTGRALDRFSDPTGNELIALSNDDYPDDLHEEDLLLRQSRRSGMLLSADELVSLAHLPSISVRSEALAREAQTTRAVAPSQRPGIVIGENRHRGKRQTVTIDPGLRMRHTYVVGASGTGKSTLLLQMILQDIENGHGVGVLDPHGDLIDVVLGRLPENRVRDVAILDPSDEEFPVGLNILEAHSEVEKNLLSSDLVAIFQRFATSWGDQMTTVLGNTILAFLESREAGSLIDLRKFLVDKEFRREFLATVHDPEVVYYFEKEYPQLKGNPASPILTRLDSFLRPKLIRYMVGQRRGALSLRRVMDDRKILLAKLPQGIIGHENAHLLGALLVAKFHQAALSRQQLPEPERHDFHLYIDEFQNFTTPSMASLLAEARKYHLGLVLAHQDLRQLQDQDGRIGSAVLTNPATRICFRVGDQDARTLARGFNSFDAGDLQSLGVGEAICRLERSDRDFNLKTIPIDSIDGETARLRAQEAIDHSRRTFARARDEVERELGMSRAPTPAAVPEVPVVHEYDQSTERPATPRTPATTRPGASPRSSPAPPTPSRAEQGRGGREHKYLQNLIRRLAEDRGFVAKIEETVLGGGGRVDVHLERAGLKIACEISVSTNPEREIENIQKCLAAGYDRVIFVSPVKKTLRDVERTAHDSLSGESADRLCLATPEEVVALLDETASLGAGPTASTVRGYKVRVKYRAPSSTESRARAEAISKVLVRRRQPGRTT